MSKPKPDLSPLLPDDATLKARRGALVDAVGSGGRGPQRAPGRRRRTARLALGAAMAMAVIAAVLIFRAGGDPTPAAFAVEPQEGGGVTIRVYSLEDASGLEDALEDAGIRAQVSWLPLGKTCDETRFTPSIAKLPGGGSLGGFTIGGPGTLTISVGSTRSSRGRPAANVNLDPAAFRPDQSVVLFGSPKPFGGDPEGGFEAHFQVVEGPVEPCRPVSAPAGSVGSIPIPKNAGSKPAGSAPLQPPAPGQLLYTKTKVVQLQGWEPDGRGAGSLDKPRHFTANLLGPEADALPAMVTTVKEVWMTRDGTTRERETLDQVEFLSAGDQERWEAAGSPPPFAYDPAEHAVKRDSAGRPVKEYASRSWRGSHEFDSVAKLSRLPTEPDALRLAIENRGGNSAPSPAETERGAMTAERLLEILREPITSPALRAAAIGALAEIPGIALEHDVTDAVGRRGDAITWVRDRGFGSRLIFDPRSYDVLADAEVIFDADAAEYPGVPDSTPFRETAYLQSETVDSDHKRPPHATP